MKELRVLELFGGIGACTQAFKRLGINHKVVDYVEINKFAVKSYNAVNNTNYGVQDITEWDKTVEVDFIMHGSPCQDFSSAGLGKGADEGSKTRSSLMYETVRIVRKLRPKYVLWENVKAVLAEKNIHNFNKYLEYMEELGYHNYFKVLNASEFNIPQNRNRLFCLSCLDDLGYDFPDGVQLTKTLADILEDTVDEKYYLTQTQIDYIQNCTFNQERKRIQEGPLCGTLLARDSGGPKCVRVDGRPRKLTPLEYWRLMGFSDESYYKAQQVNSASQLYKEAGNSIVVNVLEGILGNIDFAEYKERNNEGIEKEDKEDSNHRVV